MANDCKSAAADEAARVQFIAGMEAWLRQRGYATRSVSVYTTCATRFLLWAARTGRPPRSLGYEDAVAYGAELVSSGRWQDRGRRSCIDYTAARRFVAYLRQCGLGPQDAPPTEADKVLQGFQWWVRVHRGLMETTIAAYSRRIERLLDAVGADPGAYTAEGLRAFVLEEAARRGPCTAEALVTAVRVFLRYLVAIGACPATFRHAIPSVAKWRLARLPRHLGVSEIERVLQTPDLSTDLGVRDHAVLLLLARLGLRGADIASMVLDDLEWSEGRVRVAGKGRRDDRLPLLQDVGDAILRYLVAARPRSLSSQVFLLTRAPYSAIRPHVVSQIARRALRAAQVDAAPLGARVFRHSLATSMLRKGVPLQSIAGILRHRNIDTTLHYAKVDIESLRRVAAPWPEVA